MKKFIRIKAVLLTLVLAVMAAIPLLFTACKEKNDGTIMVDLGYRIYDSDNNGKALSETPNENRDIKVGQYYKVVFDVVFDDLKATLQGESVDVTMTVNLGQYANDLNETKLLDSRYRAEVGLEFSKQNSDAWVATFPISERSVPDLSRCYFIIQLRSMGSNTNESDSDQAMKVHFDINTPKSKRMILIRSSSSPTAVISLDPKEGVTLFTKDNVKQSSNGINAIDVAVPSSCVFIKAEVYFDDSKFGKYGEKEYYENTFTGTGTNKTLTINFNELMKELTSEERFNQLMNQPSPSIYVVLTSDGGTNYMTVSIEFPWKLEG